MVVGFLLWWGIYAPADFGSEGEIIFKIEKGQGSKEIALNLEKKGLITWAPIFRMYVLVTGKSKKLKAGDYLFSEPMNIQDIVKKIVIGDIIKEKITIIEGWNLKDIGFYFEQKGMFQAEELWEFRDLEGYLFPDTYWVRRDESLAEIVQKMKDNFEKKTAPHRSEISKETIIMASLIEKEVSKKDDKELVSGILWKRLRADIHLQVDATISYITGKKTTKISKEETQIDSPYNTYLYKGLPPGPISNPGLESILAAAYPKDSEFWYYLSTPEGKTVFSKTLEEHNLAKAKYLK